jgi:hypothetical protein
MSDEMGSATGRDMASYSPRAYVARIRAGFAHDERETGRESGLTLA